MRCSIARAAARSSPRLSPEFNTRWEARGRTILSATDAVPKVMGIVNLTPDSFSDGGQLPSSARIGRLRAAPGRPGADLLDLGGESSRPGAEPVSLEEELRRVVPVVQELADQTRDSDLD